MSYSVSRSNREPLGLCNLCSIAEREASPHDAILSAASRNSSRLALLSSILLSTAKSTASVASRTISVTSFLLISISCRVHLFSSPKRHQPGGWQPGVTRPCTNRKTAATIFEVETLGHPEIHASAYLHCRLPALETERLLVLWAC